MEIGYTKPMVVVFDGHLLNIVKCLAQKEYVGLLLSHPEIGRIMVNTVVRQVELQWEVAVSTKFNPIIGRGKMMHVV